MEKEMQEQIIRNAVRESMDSVMFRKTRTPHVTNKNIGRNDPCPCGSAIKYKKCCGKN